MKNLIIFFLLGSSHLFAQNFLRQNENIYDLDKKIRSGNFSAFTEIGNYFDSKESLSEFLGYHHIPTNESNVAKRIVKENSFFLESEILIDTTTSTKQFIDFINKNKEKVVFSELADGFILTPFDKRKTDFEISELSKSRLELINSKKEDLLGLDWVRENKIDELIEQKNPLVLLKLSSALLKSRYRFNENQNHQNQIVNLIRLFTKSNIAVPNETGKMSYHLEKDFYDTSKVNLLIFFANHYKDYKWNEKENAFINKKLNVKKISLEDELFDLLSSENDSIALISFITLTQLDSKRVVELADQFDRAGIDSNYALPTFEYRFLRQLVYLTDYCKNENIDFIGSEVLRNSIELLKSDLTFSERRKLENELIETLNLEEVTAFEYWSLVYESEWELSYSAGRILDKFYSKNWNKLIENTKYLESYLLKSKLFDDLGIIGFCNNYLIKFTGMFNQTEKKLRALDTENPKIKEQIEKASSFSQIKITWKDKEKKDWDGNIDNEINDFNSSFEKIKKLKNDEYRKAISKLLSKINYKQIGEALKSLEYLGIEPYYLYSFMDRDFGFSFIGDFEDADVRKEFSAMYQQLNEENLYRHYLKKNEIDVADANGNLDFDQIYEILKYDINTALAGGGGSTIDNGVYAVIKLLEIKFDTSLGFPAKLCNSNNMYSCDARDRAIAWMNYLQNLQYLNKSHDEPVSFAYER